MRWISIWCKMLWLHNTNSYSLLWKFGKSLNNFRRNGLKGAVICIKYFQKITNERNSKSDLPFWTILSFLFKILLLDCDTNDSWILVVCVDHHEWNTCNLSKFQTCQLVKFYLSFRNKLFVLLSCHLFWAAEFIHFYKRVKFCLVL